MKDAELSLDMKESRNFEDFAITIFREKRRKEKERDAEARQTLCSYRASRLSIMDSKTKLDELTYRKTRNVALVAKSFLHVTAKEASESSDYKHCPSACEEQKPYNVKNSFFLSLDRFKMDEWVGNNWHRSSSESEGSFAAAKQLESKAATRVSTASTESTCTVSASLKSSTGFEDAGYVCFEGAESVSTFHSKSFSVHHSFDLDQKEATMKWHSDVYADENTGDRQRDDCKPCLVM